MKPLHVKIFLPAMLSCLLYSAGTVAQVAYPKALTLTQTKRRASDLKQGMAGKGGEIARQAEKDCAESAGRVARVAGQFAMDLYVVKPVSVGPQPPGGIRHQGTRTVVSQQLGLDRLLAL